MRKIITTTFLTALASTSLFAQNVGMGTSTPNASAKLDITSTNSGLLIPRVALTALNAAGPITAPATSLLVYNTATAGVSPNNVTPGYYFWTGTAWSRLLNSASADWTLLGNAGTVAATNFIGTTDAVDFITRTNNIERMRVYSGGGILVTSPNFNANAMSPAVDVQGAWLRLGDAAGNQTFTNGMGIKFHDSGINHASMQYISTTNFINFGTSGGNGNSLALDLAASPALAIDLSNRRIGIGTNAPAEAIHVIGNVRSSTLAGVGSRIVASDANGTLTNIAAGSNGQILTLVAGSPAWATTAITGWSLVGNSGTNIGTNFIGTTDNVDFATRTNNTERMRITSAGNVGIGTSTPGYRLDLATGTFAFGNSNVRTETRNDAGLQGNAGAQSGFFETNTPVNYPAGASSWWHLIDTRHSNNGNNYAMQIAGSFFDQDLWFRKTNGSATQAWTKILTTSNGWSTTGNTGTNAATNFIGTIDAVDFVTRTGNTERMRVTSAGNVGVGIVAPTQMFDVQGGNARINNAFIGDVGHGAGWAGFSNSSSANTTGYALLQSTTGDYTLINKQNTGSGYIGFRIANNDVAVITNAGNMGIGTTGPTTRLHVVADADNLPVIYGQNINTTAGTSSYGVRGECGSTGLGSAGVSGVSTNSSQNEIGVVGDYSLWGAGVFGLGWAGVYTDMPSSRDFGVFGTVNFGTGTGVYGKNTNTTVGSAYGVYCNGNFAVTGAKSASVPTSQGNQLVFSTESPEVWFEDFGYANLVNGEIHINLDELFVETVFIDGDHPMHVFLQEQGDCEGLYFKPDADGKGFTVKEKANGHSSIGFSYRIIAHRRFYQDQRFGVDANQPLENNLQNANYQKPTSKDVKDMQKYLDEQKKIKEIGVK